jgi:MoaA/NifB/PqqE/SkfB family radical SAM enzyme|tara:strand:+ start:213 stop:1412 length:1200 start_codon:yes stop_codon:yes gene_type:complete
MSTFVKRFLLKDFILTELIFRIFKKLPSFLKRIFIEFYFFFPKNKNTFPCRLTIFLTDKCNMKCAHCFIIKDEAKKTVEIGLSEYKKIFKSLNGKTSQILLTGGEPTLRKDLVDLAINANKLGGVSTVNLFSNGLYPEKTKVMLEDILNNSSIKINYQTSIDGVEKFHNENRKVKDSFAKTVETIKQINILKKDYQKRIGRVVVSMAVSKKNMSQLEEIISTLEPLNIFFASAFVRKSRDVFNINKDLINYDFTPEEIKKDGSEKFGNNYLDDNDLANVIKKLDEKIWSKYPDQMIYAYQKTTLKAKEVLEKYSKSPINSECGMGYEDLVLLPNGKVARCEMLNSYADLKSFDYNLKDFIFSDIHSNYLKKSSGCYCSHECGIGVTIMSDKKLLNELVR